MKKNLSAFESALRNLRERIVYKDFVQGEFISEEDIAQKLGISRGPVRKAFLALQSEGLTRILSTGRTQVIGLTEKDIADMYDVRLLLEQEAIQRIMAQDFVDFSPVLKVYKEMRTIHDTQSNPGGLDVETRTRLVELDYAFHKHIVSLAENRPLFNAWVTVTCLMRELMKQNIDQLSVEIQRHGKIVDTLIRRDDECPRLIAEHLELAKQSLTRLFAKELA
jgi:DNA-binding GntR family transcriptional regulator